MGLYTERARAFGFAATMLLLAALLAVLGVSPRVAAHTPEGYQQTQCGLSPPGNPCTATLECWIDYPMDDDEVFRPFKCEAGAEMTAVWGGGPPQQHKHVFRWDADFMICKPGYGPDYIPRAAGAADPEQGLPRAALLPGRAGPLEEPSVDGTRIRMRGLGFRDA